MCTARGTGGGVGRGEGGAGQGGAPRTCTFHALLPRHEKKGLPADLSLEQERLGERASGRGGASEGEVLHTMGILWHSKD